MVNAKGVPDVRKERRRKEKVEKALLLVTLVFIAPDIGGIIIIAGMAIHVC